MTIIARGQVSIALVADGANGTSAPTITSVVEEYYLSTSQTNCSGGTWSTTVPNWASGKYYWKRVKTTYSDSTTTISTAVLDKAMNDAMAQLLEVKTTADTLLISVNENINSAIGVPFKVKNWEQGSLNTTDGSELTATNYLRSEYIDVTQGDKLIAQKRDGTAITPYYHFYGFSLPYVDYVPAAKQYVETCTTGTYTIDTIANYLTSKNVETLSITASVGTNPYSSSGDYLVIYKLPLGGKAVPNTITWNGRKDTSDNIVLLYVGDSWVQIDTVTNISNAIHTWILTDAQKAAMTGDNIYVAFFAVKTGNYAGIYNATTTPFTMNPMDGSVYVQLSYTSSSSAVTVPTNAVKVRVRVNTTIKPDEFDGNVFLATAREDYTKANTVYSSLLMQKDIINLRVGKGDVINQINLSPESILISGNKVHITGQTTIDSAVISSAMIKDLAVTNAKIADATIASAKIASLDAGKITTGTLSAARIAASSITADKLAANILTAMTASSSIRITGTTIGYYSGSTLVTEINSQGMTIRRDGTTVGTIGANNISGHTDWRGLVFDLEYGTEYMAWAHRDTSGATSYTTKLIWYAKTLESGKEKGFHFDDDVWLNGVIKLSGGHTIALNGITFNSALHTRIGSSAGDCGIAFNSSNLFIGDDGKWVDFGIIREICAKLAGRSIALPTGFNSNGTATGWYNAQTFNTMTTYS